MNHQQWWLPKILAISKKAAPVWSKPHGRRRLCLFGRPSYLYTLEPFHSIPMVFKANSRTFQTMLVVVMLVVLCFFIFLLVMVMVAVVLVLRSARGSLLFVVLCSLCVLGCSMFAVWVSVCVLIFFSVGCRPYTHSNWMVESTIFHFFDLAQNM